MRDRHSSSGWFGRTFGAALTTTAVVAGVAIAFQCQFVAAQQTTVPQRRGQPPAAASTKPAGTAQHATLPVREVCTEGDAASVTESVAVQCTQDIRLPGDTRRLVGYGESSHWRTGLFFDVTSLNGAELQKATLTVEIKEKRWCGAKIGISGGNLKVSNVKAASYVSSGPTQTIDVTPLLKPIVANNGRGFGGFVLASDAEGAPYDKANGVCLSTITDARLVVDYVK